MKFRRLKFDEPIKFRRLKFGDIIKKGDETFTWDIYSMEKKWVEFAHYGEVYDPRVMAVKIRRPIEKGEDG